MSCSNHLKFRCNLFWSVGYFRALKSNTGDSIMLQGKWGLKKEGTDRVTFILNSNAAIKLSILGTVPVHMTT